MVTRLRVARVVLAALLAVSAPAWAAPLFQMSSKELGDGKMDIVVTEIERRPRLSVVEVKINARGSSVGGSMFVACSLRKLGQIRGNLHYVAKLEERPKPGQMLVGFLRDASEDPRALGPEFKDVRRPEGVLDLEQFAPLCGYMK
jgi:hypothetical protein